jgi:hypothetical protein
MDINGSFMHNSFYYNQLIKVRRYSKIQVLRNAAMHFDSGYIQGLDLLCSKPFVTCKAGNYSNQMCILLTRDEAIEYS